MNRKVVIGGLALPMLALLFLGLCWIDGAMVRSRLARMDSEISTSLPFFTVARRQESAGLFSSTVEVSYEFNPKLLQGVAAASASAKKTALIANAPVGETSPRLTLRHHIKHGPIPGFAALGLARIDTEIVIPDEARQKLRSSIGTDQPLKIVTLLGFSGGGTTTVDSPAFTYNASGEQGRIEWRGIQGRMHYSRGMNANEGELKFLGMRVTDGKRNDANFGQLRLAYDLKRIFKVLYTGKMSFSMDHLTITAPLQASGGAMEMTGLNYDFDTSASGDYVDTVAKIGLDSLSAAAFRANDIHYDFSLRHIHGPTYAALTEKLREAYAATLNGDSKDPQKILQPFKEFGGALLEHNPEFVIDRISMKMPEGAARISGKVSLPGFARSDLETSPLALVAKLDATVEIVIDEGFLKRNWGSPTATVTGTSAPGASALTGVAEPAAPSRQQAVLTQMGLYEQQGYVTRQGSKLSSHIEFHRGALTVNGKPMGPGAGAR